MTMDELRAIFAPGQKWRATYSRYGLNQQVVDIRTVCDVTRGAILFRLEDGVLEHMPMPHGSEILSIGEEELHLRVPRGELLLQRIQSNAT